MCRAIPWLHEASSLLHMCCQVRVACSPDAATHMTLHEPQACRYVVRCSRRCSCWLWRFLSAAIGIGTTSPDDILTTHLGSATRWCCLCPPCAAYQLSSPSGRAPQPKASSRVAYCCGVGILMLQALPETHVKAGPMTHQPRSWRPPSAGTSYCCSALLITPNVHLQARQQMLMPSKPRRRWHGWPMHWGCRGCSSAGPPGRRLRPAAALSSRLQEDCRHRSSRKWRTKQMQQCPQTQLQTALLWLMVSLQKAVLGRVPTERHRGVVTLLSRQCILPVNRTVQLCNSSSRRRRSLSRQSTRNCERCCAVQCYRSHVTVVLYP